jgi:hypothetical protein
VKKYIVDDVDMPGSYDPTDHFDNGYIEEGWQKVRERLNNFKADNSKLDEFHLAAHAIADFYAHTSYTHFCKKEGDKALLYNPDNPTSTIDSGMKYDSGDFDLAKFSINRKLWKKTPKDAARLWNDKIISGRYAQKGDSQDFFEAITVIPSSLTKAEDFAKRGSLPHHTEIAVDERIDIDKGEKLPDGHKLYSEAEFNKQFDIRRDAAINHISQAFQETWNGLRK